MMMMMMHACMHACRNAHMILGNFDHDFMLYSHLLSCMYMEKVDGRNVNNRSCLLKRITKIDV